MCSAVYTGMMFSFQHIVSHVNEIYSELDHGVVYT
eukprot:SAG31_NODE_189_length_20842_cov_12.518151_6_plen_35_part_00